MFFMFTFSCDKRHMNKGRALRIIRRLRIAGVDVSDWEGEFLESVEGRVQTYGRAFADPEKGAPGHALSMRQSRKLKEILTKNKPSRLSRPGLGGVSGDEAAS
jgi:hypothetical protein